jgi:Flp pilus assembly protein CpaB
VIPPGLRAVSVKVNEVIGVAGYVLPAPGSTSLRP